MYSAKVFSSLVAAVLLQQVAGWGLTTYSDDSCGTSARIAFISGDDATDVGCTLIPLPEGEEEMPNALSVGGIVDGPAVTLYSGPDCNNEDNILTVIDGTGPEGTCTDDELDIDGDDAPVVAYTVDA